jgi:hypothetical protein
MKKLLLYALTLLSVFESFAKPLYKGEWGELSFEQYDSSYTPLDITNINTINTDGATVLMKALSYECLCSYKTDGDAPVPLEEFQTLLNIGANPLLPIRYTSEGKTTTWKDHFEYHRYSIDVRLKSGHKGSWAPEQQRMAELYLGITLHFIEKTPDLPREIMLEILQYAEKLATKHIFKIPGHSSASYKKLLHEALTLLQKISCKQGIRWP